MIPYVAASNKQCLNIFCYFSLLSTEMSPFLAPKKSIEFGLKVVELGVCSKLGACGEFFFTQ